MSDFKGGFQMAIIIDRVNFTTLGTIKDIPGTGDHIFLENKEYIVISVVFDLDRNDTYIIVERAGNNDVVFINNLR